MQDYKKLLMWQKSFALCIDIHKATRDFPKDELYSMTSQIRRASLSIPSNISEGCGRYTDGDLLRFLDIAMGSVAELDTCLKVAHALDYLPDDSFQSFDARLLEVNK